MSKFKELMTEVETKNDQVIAICDAVGEGEMTADQKSDVSKLNKEIAELESRAAETKQGDQMREDAEKRRNALKGQREEEARNNRLPIGSGKDGDRADPSRQYREARESLKSVGELFVSDETVKNYLKSISPSGSIIQGMKIHSPAIEVKTLITGNSDSQAGAFIRRDYDDYVPLPRRPLTIRDVITIAQTSTDLIEYVRQSGRTNNAAIVPEATTAAVIGGAVTPLLAGVKPESALAFEIVQAAVKTIATWIPATRQALMDAPQLRDMIDTELKDDVDEVLEDQIVNGDGTGNNFVGMVNTPGLLAQAYTTDKLTTLRKAITKARKQGRAREITIAMSIEDWEDFDLLKDLEGRYYFGGPSIMGGARVWGRNVVEVEPMPTGEALVGDLKQFKLWDRQRSTVYVTDSHADFFIRNILVVLAELRAAFGCKRPSAIVEAVLIP